MDMSASLCLNVYVPRVSAVIGNQAQHPLLLLQLCVAFCSVSLVLPYLLILVLQGVRHRTFLFQASFHGVSNISLGPFSVLSSRPIQFPFIFLAPSLFLSLSSFYPYSCWISYRFRGGERVSRDMLGTPQCLGQVSAFCEEEFTI